MDIYSTAVLNGVVDNLKRPQAFLLDTFFPMVSQSEEEEIKFDVEDGQRRIAPFVSPLREGKVVEGLGYTTKTFKPAYTKDKRIMDQRRPLKRAIGERIGGDLNPAQRIQRYIAQELGDQADMLTRRFEVMASEVLRTGKIAIVGDGFPEVEVNFGRLGTLTKALTTTARWGENDVFPLDDIEGWADEVLQASGSGVTDVVFDPLAWKLFRADAKVEKILDLRRMDNGTIKPVIEPVTGAQYKGSIGSFSLWVYQDWYVDPADDTEKKIFPDYSVLLGSSDIMGVRHFGAIIDNDADYQARSLFAKSWLVPDPSRRYLLMQSAPLMVPYRPNASLFASVR